MKNNSCPNRNHSRTDPMVRICPNCGELLNPSIAIKSCSEADHDARRRRHGTYCYDCGKKLVNRSVDLVPTPDPA